MTNSHFHQKVGQLAFFGIFKAILVKQVYVNYIVTCDFNQIPLILRKNVQILSGHASHMERK